MPLAAANCRADAQATPTGLAHLRNTVKITKNKSQGGLAHVCACVSGRTCNFNRVGPFVQHSESRKNLVIAGGTEQGTSCCFHEWQANGLTVLCWFKMARETIGNVRSEHFVKFQTRTIF